MIIRNIELFRIPVPLKKPYHTSFGDLPFFDAVIAKIELDKKTGWGESTAVPGYSWETPDDVWRFVVVHSPALIGKEIEDARNILKTFINKSPFGVTPLLSALEEARSRELSGMNHLAAILNSTAEEDIESDIEKLLALGFGTIKFKIGFEIGSDIRRTRLVLEKLGGRAKLRLDANQHYSLAEARRFVRSIPHEDVELLEQPFDSHDWENMAILSRDCPIPLMLDESIYGAGDIEKAGNLGCCEYIKLKLCKAGGMDELFQQGLLVGEKGLKLVIGNGVATDISCRQEIAVADKLRKYGVEVAAGEMNGFLKQKSQIFPFSLQMSGEQAVIEKGRNAPDFTLLKTHLTENKKFSL